MKITQEIAKQDLEKMLGSFSTIGSGSEQDRAAQLILQTLGVLQRRLGSPDMIKTLYLENPDAKNIIPETVYNMAEQYVDGKINQEEATAKLNEASEQYKKVFAEAGLNPSQSKALFM